MKYRGTNPIGGLAPAYFEAIAVGSAKSLDILKVKDSSKIKNALINLVQTNEFRDVTGPGANTRAKLAKRIELAALAIKKA